MNTAQSVSHKLMDPVLWNGMFANGWKKSQNGASDVTDKSTGEILATIANASPVEIGQACYLAVKAGVQWAKVPAERRASIVRRAGEILDQYKEEASYWIVRESGSTRFKASIEVRATKEIFDHSADLATHHTEKVLKDNADMLSYIERIPLGVVGVIGPFNFPYPSPFAQLQQLLQWEMQLF